MSDQPPVGPAYQAQAAQAVGQVQSEPPADADAAIKAMTDQAVRAALSDFEQQLAAQMRRAQSAFGEQQSTIDALTRQLATVRAQAGPPMAGLLADSLAQRVSSIAAAHPDLGAAHFAGVVSQAQALAEEVKALAGGTGDQGRAEQLVHGVDAWFHRVHPRVSGKFLEGAHAAVDELERLLDALPELAPVAGAVVKAL